MNMFSILAEVLPTWQDSSPFYRITNNGGKVWLMPIKNMRIAMSLYQPSGHKGKLLKIFFPLLHRLPFPWRKLNIEKTRCSLSDDLYNRLCGLFGVDNLEFSVFCGTPCVHQKLTIQLSIGNKILGYCKISDNPEVGNMFANEADILAFLHNRGVKNIPISLYASEWYGRISLFVQSTCKTTQSRVVHKWSRMHKVFLDDLYSRTKKKLQFEQTDYYRTLTDLQQHLDWLPSDEARIIVQSAVNDILTANLGQEIECGAYHADFTPWNMFIEQGKLFVFDWEYARMTYPPNLDRYHFFTQTAIFERHWNAQSILDFMQTSGARWIDKQTYILYLLDIIARFTIRETGNITGDIAHSMRTWCTLLNYMRQ